MQGDDWESVRCSRHPERLTARECASAIYDYFFELNGDHSGKDDAAIFTGLAMVSNYCIALAAYDKGTGIAGRKRCNLECHVWAQFSL